MLTAHAALAMCEQTAKQFPDASDGLHCLDAAACSWQLRRMCAMLMPCLLSIGQLFILHTIRCFGALLFAAVMTTRQFLSILVSSFLFGNPLSVGQW